MEVELNFQDYGLYFAAKEQRTNLIWKDRKKVIAELNAQHFENYPRLKKKKLMMKPKHTHRQKKLLTNQKIQQPKHIIKHSIRNNKYHHQKNTIQVPKHPNVPTIIRKIESLTKPHEFWKITTTNQNTTVLKKQSIPTKYHPVTNPQRINIPDHLKKKKFSFALKRTIVWNAMIYWFIGILIVFSDATDGIPHFTDDGTANVKEAIVIPALFEYHTNSESTQEELSDAICPDKYQLCKHLQNGSHHCVKIENSTVPIKAGKKRKRNIFPSAIDDYDECKKIFTINPDIFDLFATYPKLESDFLSDGNYCAVIGSNGAETQTRYFKPDNDYTSANRKQILYEAAERIQKSRGWCSANVNPRSQIQYHVFCGEKEEIKNAVESWYKKSTKEGTKVHYVVGFLVILVLFCYGGCIYSAKCTNDEDTNEIQQQQQKNVFSRRKHFEYNIQSITYSDLESTSDETTEKKQHQFRSSTFVMDIEDLKKLQNEQHEPDQFINFSDLEYTSEKTLLTDSHNIYEISGSNIIIKAHSKENTHQPIHYSDLEFTSENNTESKTYQFSSSTFVMSIEDLEKLQNEIEQHEPDQFINFSDLEYTSEKTLTDSNKIYEISESNIIIKAHSKEM